MGEFSQFAFLSLVSGARIAGLATSFFLLRQASGFLDFSFGATYLVAAYVGVSFLESKLALLAAAMLASVGTLFFLRGVLKLAKAPGDNQVLAGFGVAIIAVGLALLVMGPDRYSTPASPMNSTISLPGHANLTGIQVATFFWGMGIIAATSIAYHAPWKFGVYLQAHSEAPTFAFRYGLPIRKIELSTMVLAGIGIGGAAALEGWDFGIEPETGLKTVILALIASHVFGGKSPLSAALGGFIIGGGQEVFASFLPATWKEGATYAFLLLVVTAVSIRELWRLRALAGGNL